MMRSILIKEIKAEARTVGCLTKPDRMDSGQALDQWIRILRGEEYQLGLGYHVIKNNPKPEVDHTTARKQEAALFSQNESWTTELTMYKQRVWQHTITNRTPSKIDRADPHEFARYH